MLTRSQSRSPLERGCLPSGSVAAGRKILFVVSSLDLGGTEMQMTQLAERLRRNGHSVTVVSLRSPQCGELVGRLRQSEIPVFVFPKEGFLISVRGVGEVLRLARFVRSHAFEVVHSHDLWGNLLAVPAARLARVPVILSSQRDLAHMFWYTAFRCKILSAIHRLSTGVLANSSAVKDMLVHRFRVPAERVHVLRNGVDLEQFALAKGDRPASLPGVDAKTRCIAVVANMYTTVKGHRELTDAARIVCREIPQVKFVLVGDGEERSKIEERASEAGVRDHFMFLGRRKDVPEILACCELFVLPSRAEGFPNVILEAMAAGLPVVATRVGGTPEIVEDGINGLLVPPQDPHSLAAAILRVMKDPGFAKSLGHSGQQRVRTDFSFDRLVAETEQLYSDAASGKRKNAVSADLIKERLYS